MDIALFALAGWLTNRVGGYRVFFTALVLSRLSVMALFRFVDASPSHAHLLIAQLTATC